MRLEQLHQIVEIEKQQSISKAAKALYMGQPALSVAINSFEDEIGVCMFERSHSGVVPTNEGYEILQLIHQILDGCSQVLNYSKQQRELHGTITVLVAPAYSFLLFDIVLAFNERYPKAELVLEVEVPDRIINKLSQGHANVGVVMWSGNLQRMTEILKKNGLQYESFGIHSMMFFVGKNNPLANKTMVTLEEIRQETFVTFSRAHWLEFKERLKAVEEPLLMTDKDTLKYLVSIGEAVAILPDTFAQQDIYCTQGLIKPIPIKWEDAETARIDCLVYSKKRQLTLLESKTLELIREVLADIAIK